MEVFWLIWKPQRATIGPYSTLRTAEEEAVRLLTEQPGEVVYILELIETYHGNIEIVCKPATHPQDQEQAS